MLIFPIGESPACSIAADTLRRHGIALIDHPAPEVTHLMLDVPHFGSLLSVETVLRMLPPDIRIIGGNLCQDLWEPYTRYDLLKDPLYLAKNAAITADCALRMAGRYLDRTFAGLKATVIGWGRIGKCLSSLLRRVGCTVTVAARKEEDRAMIQALGFRAIAIPDIKDVLSETELLFNTVPSPVLHTPVPSGLPAFELASQPGIWGDSVMNARGLPGKLAPRSSGELIAATVLQILRKEEAV